MEPTPNEPVSISWTLAETTTEKLLKLLYSRLGDPRLAPVSIDKELLRDIEIVIERAVDKAFDNGYDCAHKKLIDTIDDLTKTVKNL